MNSFSELLKTAALIVALSANAAAAEITGKVTVGRASTNADAVVFIERIPGKTFAPPAAPEKLDQLNLKFTPHVLKIVAGTRVAFPNSDVVRHNVFSPGPTQKFSLGTYKIGETKYQVFSRPGVVTLLCNIHAEMSAYVVVTETPYSAYTSPDGNYSIENVPPGRYLLRVWHEKYTKVPPREIVVPATGSLKGIDFELK